MAVATTAAVVVIATVSVEINVPAIKISKRRKVVRSPQSPRRCTVCH